MAVAASLGPALVTEDSLVRFGTESGRENRGLVKKLVKGSYTLTDGPNSGNTVEYVAEEVAVSAAGNQAVNVTQVGGQTVTTAGNGRQEVVARQTTQDPVDSTGTAVVLKFARVNATADGDNTIVAAVPTKKIRVLGYALVGSSGGGTITVQDSAGSPAILAVFPVGPFGGVSYAGGLLAPAFETVAGNGLEISNSAALDTTGHLVYVEV